MSKLRNAAPVTRLIATLGILTILQQVASMRWPTGFEVVTAALPVTSIKVFGVVIAKSSLILLGIALVMVVVLELLYRRTQFGRATMAAKENQRATAALGFSPGLARRHQLGSGVGPRGRRRKYCSRPSAGSAWIPTRC